MSTKCPIISDKKSDRLLRSMFSDRPKFDYAKINYAFIYDGALPMTLNLYTKSDRTIEECIAHGIKTFRMNTDEQKIFVWEFNYIINEKLVSGDIALYEVKSKSNS